MAKIDRVQEVSIDLLQPYRNNAKMHGDSQVEALARSIQEFGFLSPCIIDQNYNLIAGHGRVMAAKKLGMRKIPCLFVEGLTDEQRKAYILADNKLTEMGEWDFEVLNEELEDIDIDMSAFGFEIKTGSEWFNRSDRWDDSREEGNDEYNEFLDKFDLPKTTDDCYTPDNIYEAVAEYVSKKFNVDRKDFVRPFYPGGNYQEEKYSSKSVVVDNPPFSILAEIVDFYQEKGIRFFLFCQYMLVFNYAKRDGVCCFPTGNEVLYENGANVPTGFVSNLYTDGTMVDNDPELGEMVRKANEVNQELQKKNLPKYDYPYDVLTASRAGWLSKYGQHIILKRGECCMIRAMDAQKEEGKGIFGAGLLLSERAAAERAAAERAAAERAAALTFKLSDREKELQRTLI